MVKVLPAKDPSYAAELSAILAALANVAQNRRARMDNYLARQQQSQQYQQQRQDRMAAADAGRQHDMDLQDRYDQRQQAMLDAQMQRDEMRATGRAREAQAASEEKYRSWAQDYQASVQELRGLAGVYPEDLVAGLDFDNLDPQALGRFRATLEQAGKRGEDLDQQQMMEKLRSKDADPGDRMATLAAILSAPKEKGGYYRAGADAAKKLIDLYRNAPAGALTRYMQERQQAAQQQQQQAQQQPQQQQQQAPQQPQQPQQGGAMSGGTVELSPGQVNQAVPGGAMPADGPLVGYTAPGGPDIEHLANTLRTAQVAREVGSRTPQGSGAPLAANETMGALSGAAVVFADRALPMLQRAIASRTIKDLLPVGAIPMVMEALLTGAGVPAARLAQGLQSAGLGPYPARPISPNGFAPPLPAGVSELPPSNVNTR